MSNLEFQLVTIPDRGLLVDVTVAVNSLRPEGVKPLPMAEVKVAGTIKPMMGQYLFQGTVEGAFEQPCDRCLETASFPVSLPVVWTFEEGQPEGQSRQMSDDDDGAEESEVEDFGIFTFQGTTIDLSHPVWVEACLAAPAKFVCRDDCRGLCPVCGGNRSTAPCTCVDDHIDETPVQNSGFAGLKDLFPELPK